MLKRCLMAAIFLIGGISSVMAEEKLKMSELLGQGYSVVSVFQPIDKTNFYIFLQNGASLFMCVANIAENVCYEMKD